MIFRRQRAKEIKGSLTVPGDKSISHRAVLFGALAQGTTEITHLSNGQDMRSTRRCLEALGVRISESEGRVQVEGVGLRGLRAPGGRLDCGNSGTTIRLLMGVLAGQCFPATLCGDASLSRRPMERVAAPLEAMGARFEMTDGKFAPLTVHGAGTLHSVTYELPVASAQVKSAVLLAGLYADGTTRLTGKTGSRDHTERLLPHFGARVDVSHEAVAIVGGQELQAAKVDVPGDPSSAACWVAAACLVPRGEVTVRSVLLNPTRTGFFEVLRRMGARVETTLAATSPEPVGDVTAHAGELRGVSVLPNEVPSLVDELPMLAVLAASARGVTEVRGAEELRVKETDRIEALAENVRRMGGRIETFADGFRIEGPQALHGARLDSFDDHRIAMAFAVGALAADGVTEIERADSVATSYPAFFPTLEALTRLEPSEES